MWSPQQPHLFESPFLAECNAAPQNNTHLRELADVRKANPKTLRPVSWSHSTLNHGVRKGSGVANVSFEDVKVFLQHLLPRLLRLGDTIPIFTYRKQEDVLYSTYYRL